ncbi:glycosyltransferase family 2 protein [Bacillus sp. RA(2023)]|uniref:glycosyltransferase n=1 Tax=Bacillus TaxID=1386 RepID=UPI000B4BA522|nr:MULTISPECIES: glycosyltransferase family 2 protein [Bacillus]WPU74910.1 glycosyltransferase family 2 protein [Bacillus sp. RA(2023)]
MGKIGIVILNWNNFLATINLIDNIMDNIGGKFVYKLYVVDNGSEDNSVNIIKEHLSRYPGSLFQVIESDINLGYAQGNNLGIEECIKEECEYITILNNDIILKASIFEEMADFLSLNDDIGLVTPKILNEDQSIQKWCARKETKIIHRFVVYSPLQRLLSKTKTYQEYFYDVQMMDSPTEIELFSGAAFMMKREIFERVKMFDPNTFLYEEELILAHKIRAIDKKIYLLPKVSVIHEDGGTTSRLGLIKYKYMLESEDYYLNKYAEERFLFFKKVTLKLFRNVILLLKKCKA